METTRIQNGQTEQIEVLALDSSGNPLAGLSDVYLRIRRISDGWFLDFADNTFKASGHVQPEVTMAEVDGTNDPGKYYYAFATAGFPDDSYQLRASCSSAANFPQVGELKVGDYVDNLDASVAAVQNMVADTRRIVKNKLTIDEAGSKLQLWNDTGDAVLYEWPLTDKDGNAIVLQGTGPANRGVPA